MDDTLRYTSATIMTTLSIFGIVVNTYVFSQLIKKDKLSGFFKLCLSKTVTNTITCLAFLLWSAPCTFIDFYYLPYVANVLFGQIAGWGIYISGILLQNCILIIIICGIISTIIGLPNGCSYIYNIELLSWMPEDKPCATKHADILFYFIFTLAFLSNSSNLATFIKLIHDVKHNSSSIRQNGSRTKKSQIMFAQSVTQDCLHITDMLACQVIYKFNDALWFQFICMSVVWLSIHVFDGVVILLYNRDIQPKWMIHIYTTTRIMVKNDQQTATTMR